MSKARISYEKVYTDDAGKKIPEIKFADGDTITPKMLWYNVVDGFFSHDNTGVCITALSGNIRIVVVSDESSSKFKFEQYFLSAMDGKVVEIPYNTKYAIQNVDEGKSVYLMASADTPDYEYFNKSIFNWRKKQP
jgi:dTDP-4-dehydrorhamnose 3,5-epimerase-like enzyme